MLQRVKRWICGFEWPVMMRRTHYASIMRLTDRMEARRVLAQRAEELRRSVEDLRQQSKIDPKEFELVRRLALKVLLDAGPRVYSVEALAEAAVNRGIRYDHDGSVCRFSAVALSSGAERCATD